MGKASSSKKVQRAARAAASSRGVGERRERGFPLLVLAVVLLGVGLVVAARSSRETPVAPLIQDHWHSVYEIYDCGTARPPIQTTTDPDGIHTHADGLLHIHPFNSSATGNNAKFGVFFDASGLTVSADMIDATGSADPGFEPIENSTGCDDEDSEIVITRWSLDGEGEPAVETTYRSDFADIRFLEEGEAFTIAKVPVGEDAPPPSVAALAALAGATGTTNLEPEITTTTAPGDGTDTSSTTTPGDGTDTTTTAPGDGTDTSSTTTPADDGAGSTTTAPADGEEPSTSTTEG